MKKNILKISVVLVMVGVTVSLFVQWYAQPKPYNVLLIVSDSLRFDVLGAMGGEALTPNIDWLVGNGCNFVNAHSSAPRTLPSSVGMLTGNSPAAYPFVAETEAKDRYEVPDSEYLFAEVLKDRGYQVKAFVTNPYSYVSNNLQGFDVIKAFPPIKKEQKENVEKVATRIRADASYQQIYAYIDYLSNVKEQNFFSLLWIEDPHTPYAPPEDYKSKISVDVSRLTNAPEKYSLMDQAFLDYSQYEQDYTKELYLKEVESMDERVGLILKMLVKSDLIDKTIIVFTADHGEHFGEHGEAGHGGSYFEELLHVPLVIAGPGIKKNQKIEQNVSLLDLPATLANLLKVKLDNKTQGRSVAKLLKGGHVEESPQYVVGTRLEYQNYIDAILFGNYKIIAKKDGAFLMYDILNDRKEQNNIYGNNKDSSNMKRLIGSIRLRNEDERVARSKHSGSPTSKSELDDQENMQRLKSLGYVK